MDKREKQREVFIKLINKQLEPFGVNYNDVKSDPDWYMRYRITPEQEQEFIEWGIDLIRKKLKMSKKMAEQEMSWFILQWGLTTNQVQRVDQVDLEKVKSASPVRGLKSLRNNIIKALDQKFKKSLGEYELEIEEVKELKRGIAKGISLM